ncbi:MAG: C40 family peptidase [Treponema sp.]|nr:C40 family peptidase [Candidatus Treponema scatequi]
MKLKKFLLTTLILFFSVSIFANENSSKAAKQREAVCAKAKSYIGCPYKTGAIGPDSFDCSGLVFTVFREAAGVQLPRSAKAIYSAVKIVSSDLLEEGDLVFFKTTGNGQISHVGIYIGRNQFIHAASDGSNTGVIASSLTEKYYKNCYAGVGKALPTAKTKESDNQNKKKSDDEGEIIEEDIPDDNENGTSSSKVASKKSSGTNFLSNVTVDSLFSCDWSLWLPRKFMINWRGLQLNTVARYTKWPIQPGVGTSLRWNYGASCFQIPITFNLTFNDYVNIYIGPVITIGVPRLPETSTKIRSSFFPGIIGVTFSTPSIKAGKVNISISQDISYTVFNGTDGGALPINESLSTGFVFSTGIRVTLPLNRVLN